MSSSKARKSQLSSKDVSKEQSSAPRSLTYSATKYSTSEPLRKSSSRSKRVSLRSGIGSVKESDYMFELQDIASRISNSRRVKMHNSFSSSSESVISDVKDDTTIPFVEAEVEESNSSDFSSMETDLIQNYSEVVFEWDPNFLNQMIYLPDVEDITMSSKVDSENIGEESMLSDDQGVGGKFTKLLDISGPHPSEDVPVKETEELEEIEEEEKLDLVAQKTSEASTISIEESSSLSKDDMNFDEYDELFEQLVQQDDVGKQTDKQQDVTFEIILEYEDGEEEKKPDKPVNDAEQEERKRLLVQQTKAFLNDLIDRCVSHSEDVFATKWLRKNLDKRKLITAVNNTLNLLNAEQWVYNYLHRKCVDHYRKAKCFRKIIDNTKTLSSDIEKFHDILLHLDLVLRKEKEIREHSEARKIELQNELEAETSQAKEEVAKLEQLMKQTLNPINSARVETVINRALREMSFLRNQISSERFKIILHQHNVGSLMQQLNNVEDLGNNMSMKSYETIQTEVTTLTKKLEEKNADLSKLQYRCYHESHSMAHLKEKQRMVRHNIANQKLYLSELQMQKRKLRQDFFNLKAARSRIQKDMRDCSFQGGLLDKPILMADYDKTEQQLIILRERVNRLKQIIAQKNSKIEALEANCNRNYNFH